MNKNILYKSIDLFSGCGGLSEGMKGAGFKPQVAIEIDSIANQTYKLNHENTLVIEKDIRAVKSSEVIEYFPENTIHLLAGCPPCQGFSSIRRLNKKRSKRDERNSLVLEFLRMVKELKPLTIMMENVPGLSNYYKFQNVVKELKKLGYNPKYGIVNIASYGVPQNRKRLVMVGSLLGELNIAGHEEIRKRTVRKAIGKLESIENTKDHIHKIVARHTYEIQKLIEQIPKNGGSRKDVPERTLDCHKKEGVGFKDVYGRLRWDDFSTTITGGCLNPSKGRFLHPEENRCITAREAAILQSFRKSYKFPPDISKTSIALMIGNALPPRFSYYQSKNIKKHLDQHLS